MHIRTLFAAALLAASPAWAVNKCVGSDGKVSYQQAPCDRVAPTSSIYDRSRSNAHNFPGNKDVMSPEEVAKSLEAGIPSAQRVKAERDRAIRAKGLQDLEPRRARLQIGMTADQVRAAWGEPTSVNRTVTERNTHEQWVYRQRSKTDYVYMDGGVVRSFQTSD